MRDVLVAVAASIDHLSNQRRRAITQQMHGEPVRFAETRIVELGEERVRSTMDGGLDGPLTGTLGGAGTGEKKRKINLATDWWFGTPVFEGIINSQPVAVEVRTILNGYHLTYQGVEVAARVFTDRETELMAKMPPKAKPDASKFLLCPMPGLVVSLNVRARHEAVAVHERCRRIV